MTMMAVTMVMVPEMLAAGMTTATAAMRSERGATSGERTSVQKEKTRLGEYDRAGPLSRPAYMYGT